MDKNERKREVGKAFGMTDFVNPSDYSNKPVSQVINDLTGGQGVDYSFECTGVASLITEALQATKVVRFFSSLSLSYVKYYTDAYTCLDLIMMIIIDQGKGVSTVLGIANVPTVDIRLMALLSGKTLKGCFFGRLKVQSDIPLLVDKCIHKASSHCS